MMNIRKVVAYIKLVLTILIWASIYHVAKYLIGSADPYTLGFLRFFIATIILFSLYFLKHGVKGAFTRPDNHWKTLWLLGLIGVFGYNIFFFGAESLISANNIAIFFAFTPCITVVLGRFVLGQSIRPLAYIGIVIALLGTIGVISFSYKAPGSEYSCVANTHPLPLGEILAILSAFAMAGYNVFNKKASSLGLDTLTITTFSALIGCIFLFISFILFGSKFSGLIHQPLMFWLAILYVAIMATVIAYKWYSDAIRELGMGKTAIFQNGIPLCTVIMGVVLFGDHISSQVILSGLIIIFGVILTNLAVHKI